MRNLVLMIFRADSKSFVVLREAGVSSLQKWRVIFFLIPIFLFGTSCSPKAIPKKSSNGSSVGSEVDSLDLPLEISRQPSSQTVTEGDSVEFSVSLKSGTGLGTYQWFFAGEPLTGKTESRLVISSAVEADEGQYLVKITNRKGILASQPALLRVNAKEDPLPSADQVSIATGGYHSCASIDGRLKCWGWNERGQLGRGDLLERWQPVPVYKDGSRAPLTDVKQVSVGGAFSCALMKDGVVKCWGDNTVGQTGTGTGAEILTYPSDVLGFGSNNPAHSISSGWNHVCAIAGHKRKLYCWGQNLITDGTGNWYGGQLGLGDYINRNAPAVVESMGEGVVQVAAGHYSTCAINVSGQAYCWGGGDYNSQYGALGIGHSGIKFSSSPLLVYETNTGGVTDINVGFYGGSMIQNGALKTWGYNHWGEVGNDYSAATNYPGFSQWGPFTLRHPENHVSLIGGGYLVNLFVENGSLKAVGYNGLGNLGIGAPGLTESRSAQPVSGLNNDTHVVAISRSRGNTSCVFLSESLLLLKCWGQNDHGQVGVGGIEGAGGERNYFAPQVVNFWNGEI